MSVIADLQQALNCTSKCDCCNKLQQQINEINSRIANLKPVDEQAIVNRAIEGSKLLMPGIAATVVAMKLSPVITEVGSLSKLASEALTVAKGASGTATNALSKYAGILTALAALGVSVGVLNSLGNRIDSVESALDSTSALLSRAFGLIQTVKSIATGADTKAEKAQTGVDDLYKASNTLSEGLRDTKKLAATALDRAVAAERKADMAQATADRAAEIASIGVKRADKANNRLDNVEPLLDLVNERVIEQRSDINALTNGQLRLRYDVDQLSGQISNLEAQIPGIDARANQAIQKATSAEAIANTANNKASDAQQEAEAANVKAQAAILENAKLKTKISALEQKDIFLQKEIDKAQIEAYAAAQLAGVGIATAQNTAQGLSNVVGRVGIIGGTAINADGKATTALGQISTIKNGVVTSPAIQNAVAQIGGVATTQQKQQEQIKQIEQKISTPGANAVTRGEIDQIKQKLGEADKMNKEGLGKLDDILGKLPYIPALTATAVATKVPSINQVKQAVGEATCESAKSGCIAGALSNQSADIKNNFGQKLRDLEQGLNAGANAAQLTLLNTINTKLGAEVVGGVTGLMNRIASSQLLERTLSVMTFAATVHNAAMLSNNIAQTLLGAINNVLGLVLPKDHNGQAIDVGQIINSSVENAIKGAIGATNYANLTEAWLKANRIYQATTNMLWSVQSMFDSVRSVAEMMAGNTGKIGNALRKAGVVFENAYGSMAEQVTARTASQAKWDNIIQNLETVENAASALNTVTGEIVSINDNFNELKNQRKEFNDAREAAETAVTNLITQEKQASSVSQNIPDSAVLRAGS